MKKILFALCLFVSLTTTAQKVDRFAGSIGAELAAVTGNLNTAYSIAAGATAQLDFRIDNDAAITFNSGVIVLVGKKYKNSDLKYRSEALIPLLAGVKYYFIPRVYGSAQLGASFSTRSAPSPTSITSVPYQSATFTYIPGIGFKIDDKLDLLVKYTGLSDRGGTFGIRLGYNFF